MNKRNLPTVDDVANLAGVSTATVSRCINEPQKVSENTRKRVMAAVKELHYAPNFGARAIAANRTGTFGAVIPTMENAIFARGIEAFQKGLAERNATLLVASSAYDSEQEARLIRALVSRGADGMLLIGNERDREIYDFLQTRNIPFVIAWAKSAAPGYSCVGFDNRTASKNLVSTAIALGHRSIAYISARTQFNDRARERVAGAKEAIQNAGLNVDDMTIIETEYSIKNGRNGMESILTGESILKGKNNPTLIICGNDVLAVGAIQQAKLMGFKIPDDISIVGFDDIEISEIIEPSLTTIHVPHRQMGMKAAEALLDLVQDSNQVIDVELETRIVKRESLGPAPGI